MAILVVEDDADVRTMVVNMLDSEGYKTLEAENGKKAIRLIKNNPNITIVITDIIMPEKEGIEMIRELKQDYPHFKIMAISGGGQIDANTYLKMARLLGAEITLNKPFVKKDLIEAVEKLDSA